MSVQHEETDVNIRAIFGFGAGLIAVTLVVYLVVWLLFVYFDRREVATNPPGASVGRRATKPGCRRNPGCRSRRVRTLRELHTRQQALLDGYRWVDKSGRDRAHADR